MIDKNVLVSALITLGLVLLPVMVISLPIDYTVIACLILGVSIFIKAIYDEVHRNITRGDKS